MSVNLFNFYSAKSAVEEIHTEKCLSFSVPPPELAAADYCQDYNTIPGQEGAEGRTRMEWL